MQQAWPKESLAHIGTQMDIQQVRSNMSYASYACDVVGARMHGLSYANAIVHA